MSFRGHNEKTVFLHASCEQKLWNQAKPHHLGWGRWEDQLHRRLLVGPFDEWDKPAKTEMHAHLVDNSLLLLFWGRIGFSGLSLRPSFLPKSFPGVFDLKLGRILWFSRKIALHYELHNSLWSCPFPSSRYTSINHNWAFRHMVQVSGSSSRWRVGQEKDWKIGKQLSNPQICFFGSGFCAASWNGFWAVLLENSLPIIDN